jgi:uncharacterized membrane protein
MIAFKIAATAFILLLVVLFFIRVIYEATDTQMSILGWLSIVLGLTTVGGLIVGCWLL